MAVAGSTTLWMIKLFTISVGKYHIVFDVKVWHKQQFARSLHRIDCLVQDCSNSIANARQLLQYSI